MGSTGVAETPCVDPATGEVFGASPEHGAEEAFTAIRSARSAQVDWARRPLSDRTRCGAALRRLILDEADEIAATINRSVGKPRVDALATEVMPTVLGNAYYCRNARRWLKPERLRAASLGFANKRSTVYRVPWGVVGIIAPWNFPLGIPMHEILPALLAGNSVVFKTAPETQAVGLMIEDLIRRAGFPEGVFHHLNLPGSLAGEVFLHDRGVDKLFFTGSVRVGRILAEKAGRLLTPVSLELGGNDPMLVCADADLDRAASGATWGGTMNCGQSCAGVERIYVHESVHDDFLDRLRARVDALRIGPDRSFETDLGPLCTERQADTVRAHVADALERGARILARAEPPDRDNPRYVPAMVLVDVDHEMRIMREETFGPVMAVMGVRDMDEAVMLANDSDLGLTASVWTRDRREGVALARRIQAGVVTINDHVLSHGMSETPWGGVKASGIGRGHGRFGFEAMTQLHTVIEDRLALKRNPWWQPYSETVYRGMHGILIALHGSGLRSRLAGLRAFLRLLPRMLFRDRD